MRVIEIHGDHYHIGYQHGQQVLDLAPLIRRAIDRRLGDLTRVGPAIETALAEMRQVLAEAGRPILDMVRGLADALQLDYEMLLRYTIASYAQDRMLLAGDVEGCTAWAASGIATRNSQPILVKNRDYRQDHLDLQILVRATPATGYRYLSVSSAGSPAVFSSGINEAGLAVVDTHVPSRDLGPGLPRYALMRELMEQHATVPTALEYLKSAPRTGDGNLVLTDASGNLAAFEVGHRACGIVEAPAGWVVATNHFVTPEMEAYYVPEGQRHLRGSSRRRRAVVEEALQAARGQIDVAWARQLMARHGGPLDALCRHKNLERGRATISTSIFLPVDRQLLFCHGQPCQAEYHAFRISQT